MLYSLKTKNGQDDSSKTQPYASRLREERVRVEPHQGKFCEKIGVSRQRQSFLENGDRELRADYLDLISTAGIDISYVITGRRSGDLLSERESALLDAFVKIDDVAKDALLILIHRMRTFEEAHEARMAGKRSDRTLHESSTEFMGE